MNVTLFFGVLFSVVLQKNKVFLQYLNEIRLLLSIQKS